MDLVPLRAAAGGGTIDGRPAAQLVAAGFTLLQRSAPLVRALGGRRAAILLPNSGHFLTALAACDGRGAVLLAPTTSRSDVAALLGRHDVGAVFTLAVLADHLLNDATPRVLLDDAPATARVVIPPHAGQRVDLGSHFGLELSGDDREPGRDEECVLIGGIAYSHRALLDAARRVIAEPLRPLASDHGTAVRAFTEHDGLVRDLIAPLIAGARVVTS